jgi:hypothetical protein
MRLLHVAIKGLQVELELAEMLGLELDDLQLERYQAIERAIEEKQIQREISPANLDRVLAAEVAEIAAELDQELLELLDQSLLQVDFGMRGWQVEELNEMRIFEDRCGVWMQICQRC